MFLIKIKTYVMGFNYIIEYEFEYEFFKTQRMSELTSTLLDSLSYTHIDEEPAMDTVALVSNIFVFFGLMLLISFDTIVFIMLKRTLH